MSVINQPPAVVHKLFGNSLWRSESVEGEQPRVFLTFDDGPVPEQTPWVLDVLDRYHVRGSFFLVGDNVHKYPDLLPEIRRRGHVVGNHTYNHMQLFKSSWSDYVDNIRKCDEVSGQLSFFRPPHGQMLPWRALQIERTHNMVFWDVMPADYDSSLSVQDVFGNVKRYVRNGSVIVLHDSIKAGERMRYTLQNSIEMLLKRGYSFATVDAAFKKK
ncbi:MAG: polysaccharide deacetylase family protein [Marinilabiliaceae bacterium]|nr:polysaccharide deacetylase family protein [Marinilabiliaceae bacterium]